MKPYRFVTFCLTIVITLLSLNLFAQEAGARDPTKPPAYTEDIQKDTQKEAEQSNGGYELKAILIGQGRRLALINEQYVRLGDRIGDARVIAIEQNAVTLSEAGRRVTIYLFDRGIRD